MVYGVGGLMAVNGSLTVGTLIALTALLAGCTAAHGDLQRPRRHHDRPRVLRVFEVLDPKLTFLILN